MRQLWPSSALLLIEERRALEARLEAELAAKTEASSSEIDQLRTTFEGEREELSAELARRQMELTQARADFDRERDALTSSLKSREDELAAVRADFARERGALTDKAEALEAKRVELRSAFERINQLRVEPVDAGAGPGSVARGKHDIGAEGDVAPGARPIRVFGHGNAFAAATLPPRRCVNSAPIASISPSSANSIHRRWGRRSASLGRSFDRGHSGTLDPTPARPAGDDDS